MKVITYDQEGKEVGETLLPKEIFGLSVNMDLIHQVVVSQQANRRHVIAHTKDRGEVSGGGKKPWRQKGTGRARHGSTRSPIWRHGGVTFGPTNDRVFKKKINKKIRRKALCMVLSDKAQNNFLVLIAGLKLEKAKTKTMADILKKLPCKSQSALIALPGSAIDKNIVLAARNLTKVKTLQAKDLNALDLLTFKYLVMPKESIKAIKETFTE